MVDKERANPYKKVLQVLYLMAVIKRPVHRSAFSFNGAQPPSRINLTKKVHGGKFTNEEVEDVKTFLRLLLVLAFIFILLTVYTGVSNCAWDVEDREMREGEVREGEGEKRIKEGGKAEAYA